ncbi:hypothetical protein OIDMADRAFT_22076 [Oidiodendron maius Zn]|uniref:Heterokaryon incompatibility domain-containing protein n=1 Tax=Oidiodendron maius (strain Zn) TaxID=913774 RepID=A0A0C3HW89_OIDMZ|nr:hypothetical protein OIDMADRAFT_22076 [Oidiodendron maius Zn]
MIFKPVYLGRFPDLCLREKDIFRVPVEAGAQRARQLMPKIYTSASLVLGWLGNQDNMELMPAGLAIKILGDAFRSRGWDPLLGHELAIRNTQKPESVPDHIWFKFRPPESTEFTGIRNITRFGAASALHMSQSTAATVNDRVTTSLHISEIGGTLLATDPRDHIYGLLGLCSLPIQPRIPFASLSGPILSLAVVRFRSLERIGGCPTLKNLKEGEVKTWCQAFVLRHPSYPNQTIPALWVLFLVAMRMQALVFDTSTVLLLQHFILSLQYAVPEHNAQRIRPPHTIRTPEVKGLSVGVRLDGSHNPEFTIFVSPDVGYQTPGQSLEKRMFEVKARLVLVLERKINSRLFETDGGFLGMGPKYCEQEDIVCLVDGYEDLVLLRKSSDRYQYIGPCMVLGLSSTYIKNQLGAGKLKVEIVELVRRLLGFDEKSL